MKKVLLIRLDKIGDLISTMCVDESSALDQTEVRWVISKGLGFVPDWAQPSRAYVELSKDDWKASLQALRGFIHDFKPDVAISFQAPWWVNYALWAEKVPVRSGVLSQWHSFLFLNRGLRQRRSRAIKHEADYNLDVVKYAMGDSSPEKTPILELAAPNNPDLLAKHNLTPNKYVVIHPGMAGSALNWPISHYIELIHKITPQTQVVLTGTPADEPWLTEIKETFKDNPRVLNLQSQLKAPELFTILKNSQAVVVPSTGVAHMAASLGANVLGLYSPLRVQHPTRWAARGPHVHIFVPKTQTENCMEQISVEDVLSFLGH